MLTPAHIERRRFWGTRWDPDAIMCLCVPCHDWFDHERTASALWLVDQIGQDAVDVIHQKSRGPMPTPGEVESELARSIAGGFAPSWRSRVSGESDASTSVSGSPHLSAVIDACGGFDYTEALSSNPVEGAMMRLTDRGRWVLFVIFWGVAIPIILFGLPR